MKFQHSSGRHDTILVPGQRSAVESLPWNPHPEFRGVHLRHLVTGKESGGHLSLHHVKIDPGCTIGDHAHAGRVEIHDVMEGAGTCTLEGSEIAYAPGTMGVMPAGRVHRIDAGTDGLLLLATFSPALM